MNGHSSRHLRARLLGIDTQTEAVVFLRKHSPVCRSEGFASLNRVELVHGDRHVIATLYQVESDMLATDEAGLSLAAWRALGLKPGDSIGAHHAPPVASLSLVRSRIFGHDLGAEDFDAIIADVVAGHYSAVEMSSFVTACAARPMAQAEILSLTAAMVKAGERLAWGQPIIADKHSVGGLPGNRTTPIVVAICASLGLHMPKTSSRAITSPAGTADTMEVLAPVALDEKAMRKVVECEGGCIVWGGAVNLSPADDILIRIERALDIDSEGQMIASVMSKKIAAGATHLVIDMPVGPTAKVRGADVATRLAAGLSAVAENFGIGCRIVTGDGSQPIGRGMGPALEALDVLAVLKGDAEAPADLKDRALALAGALLELTAKAEAGAGLSLARAALEDGRAWAKFQRICEAQGGMRVPPRSRHRRLIAAEEDGILAAIDTRRLARLAKLAGAPEDAAAGIEMHARLGDRMEAGKTPLFTLHADAVGELSYAMDYAGANADMFTITHP